MKKSIVISCAGKGSRLGFQIPKCLVKIDGDELEISTDYLDTNFTAKLEINDN